MTAPFRRDFVPSKNLGIRALLVSADIQTIDLLCYYMGKLAMHVDVCSDFMSASRKLCHAKYEAIVVDFKEATAALDLLKKSREMTSHKAAVVMSHSEWHRRNAERVRAGASFVLVKPIPAAVLVRTLNVSYPLMLNERRRYFPGVRCGFRAGLGRVPADRMADLPVTLANSASRSTHSPALQVGIE